MNPTRFYLALPALVAGLALAAPLAADAPLIEDKGVVVTATDFEAALARVPEEKRPEVRASHGHIMTLLDTTYLARQVAARARAQGMDKDPVVQKRLEQAQDTVLAEIYMQNLEKTAALPDLEQRARELYRAEPEKYRVDEHIYIQHILVGLNGRTREMALERARELRKELDAGKEDFLAMAKRVSDDPDKRRNNGDLGFYGVKNLEAPLVEASRTMKKNEISQPIETRHGYHIIRFIDRKPAETIPFEAARKRIIAAEREKLMKEKRDAVLKEIRDSSTVLVHRANIEALRTEIDMKKAVRDPATAQAPR